MLTFPLFSLSSLFIILFLLVAATEPDFLSFEIDWVLVLLVSLWKTGGTDLDFLSSIILGDDDNSRRFALLPRLTLLPRLALLPILLEQESSLIPFSLLVDERVPVLASRSKTFDVPLFFLRSLIVGEVFAIGEIASSPLLFSLRKLLGVLILRLVSIFA